MANVLAIRELVGSKKGIPFFMVPYTDSDVTGSKWKNIALNSLIVLTGTIISKSVPESVSDKKTINWGATQIPGGHTAIPKFGSFGARTISFNIKLVEKNSQRGLSNQLKALEALRYPAITGGFGVITDKDNGLHKPFTPNPKVLYMYGTGTLLMSYYVMKCDWDLTKFNKYGFPQVADVSIELTMEETGILYQVESGYRLFAQLFNGLRNKRAIEALGARRYQGNPYITRGISGSKTGNEVKFLNGILK